MTLLLVCSSILPILAYVATATAKITEQQRLFVKMNFIDIEQEFHTVHFYRKNTENNNSSNVPKEGPSIFNVTNISKNI